MVAAAQTTGPATRARLRLAGTIAFVIVVVILLLGWLMGAFHTKIEPGPAEDVLRVADGAAVITVGVLEFVEMESSTGTVEPVHQTAIGSRLLARVTEISVTAGSRVETGQVIARLDDEFQRATLEEARATLVAAEARLAQAESDRGRAARLAEQGLVPVEEREQTETLVRTAAAEVERARQTVAGAETALRYAEVRSPMRGVVVDKQVEAGDMVSPGQTLVTIYDPGRMQLVAEVRESLGARLAPGDVVQVTIDTLDLVCEGSIAEVVPMASPGSRTFEVKVTGPCPPGVKAGMFGRLSVPVGKRERLVVPASAVLTVGQLDMVVAVLPDGRVLRRFVQLGDAHGDVVEVLSGIQAGERILADPQSLRSGR